MCHIFRKLYDWQYLLVNFSASSSDIQEYVIYDIWTVRCRISQQYCWYYRVVNNVLPVVALQWTSHRTIEQYLVLLFILPIICKFIIIYAFNSKVTLIEIRK